MVLCGVVALYHQRFGLLGCGKPVNITAVLINLKHNALAMVREVWETHENNFCLDFWTINHPLA